jgi:hypothetical protein
VSVTCPCGRTVALRDAYRCWFCGLFFCFHCAEQHFGPKPLMAEVVSDSS